MEKSDGINGDTASHDTTPKKGVVIESAEILLSSKDIAEDISFWTSEALGFRMNQIYPADDPRIVTLSGHGLHLRLDKSAATTAYPSTIRLLCSSPLPSPTHLTSPSGTQVHFVPAHSALPQPATKPTFCVSKLTSSNAWITGRAGMHYRDLIPSRLGGSIIASHIRIPSAGPVPDNVHYHEVGFQLIYCYAGWVRVVYEDQGPPFVMYPGDCVIQPPGIRHRVLESGEGLQVVEVGVPAEHLTRIDWGMELPTAEVRGEREWEGQRFVHSLAGKAVWGRWRVDGFEARDTGVGVGTKGVASVQVVRPLGNTGRTAVASSHDAGILFTFVLTGSCRLVAQGKGVHELSEGDAFTVPVGLVTRLDEMSGDLTFLEVSLPAEFKTTVHGDVEML